ncbi:MAG: GNAT family N-acyltransferase [Byssovorax sp.]
MTKNTMPPSSSVRRIRVVRSETDAALLDHFNVRFDAFAESTAYAGTQAGSPFEADLFDAMKTGRTLLTAYVDDAPMGAVRVLWARSAVGLAHGWRSGLPIEGVYDLGALAGSTAVAEPGRLCVLAGARNSGVALHLIDAVFDACRERGVTMLLAPANTETDAIEDVAILAQILAAKGHVSTEHRLVRKVPAGAPVEAERPLYDAEQRARAAAGDLSGLVIPRTLKLYLRLGARFIGDAIFDPKFGLFALPMIVPVAAQNLLAPPAASGGATEAA